MTGARLQDHPGAAPTLKARLQAEDCTVFGMFITSLDRSPVISLAAAAGVDFVVLDAEHNPFDERQIAQFCELAALRGMTTLVRTAASPPDAARLLDIGADGLMIPRLADAAQARQYVRHSYFPPLGERGYSSWAPTRTRAGTRTALRSESMAQSNARTTLMIQIETDSLAVQVEQLAATPGVDVITVGFNDLTVSRHAPDASRDAAEIGRILAYQWRPGLAAKGCHSPGGVPELPPRQPRAVFIGHDLEFFGKGLREAMRPHLARDKAAGSREVGG